MWQSATHAPIELRCFGRNSPSTGTIQRMVQPQVKSLSESVFSRLVKLLHEAGHIGRIPAFERRQLTRDLEKLAATHAFEAQLGLSVMASLDGDESEAERLLTNATKIGDPLQAEAVRLFGLSNYGRATQGLDLLKRVAHPGMSDLSRFIREALPAGAFESISRLVDESAAMNQVLSSECNEHIAVARQGAAALQAAGLTEARLAQVLDVAGEVQRENGLLWLNGSPQFICLTGGESEDSAPGVHAYFRMDISPEEALKLTDEIGWRLVKKDLVQPGLSVTFIGAKDEAACA